MARTWAGVRARNFPTLRQARTSAGIDAIAADRNAFSCFPGMRLSRPGRLLIMLTDETGAKRYVAIQGRRAR
jgi:hypothetical protein